MKVPNVFLRLKTSEIKKINLFVLARFIEIL